MFLTLCSLNTLSFNGFDVFEMYLQYILTFVPYHAVSIPSEREK
jgi:hypothetical protein